MNSSTKQPSKFRRFLRNNAALLLLIFSVLAIVAVVLAVTLPKTASVQDGPVANKPDDPGPDDPNPDKPITEKVEVFFQSPLAYTSISLEYTDGDLIKGVWKPTLLETSAHQALDLVAADGTDVVAMFDGKVIEADSSFEMGHYVVIDHGDNVIVTYASLSDTTLSVGDQVKQGEVIGQISTSARSEFKDGAHLHLEVQVNGEYVNPKPYVEGKVSRIIEKNV